MGSCLSQVIASQVQTSRVSMLDLYVCAPTMNTLLLSFARLLFTQVYCRSKKALIIATVNPVLRLAPHCPYPLMGYPKATRGLNDKTFM